MTVLALSMSTSYLMGEKSQLEYMEMEYTNEYNDVTSELTDYLDNGKSSDDAYKQLQSRQQGFDSKKTTIESRLKVINSEIEGYKEAVKNNVKECKLSISV